MKIIDYNDYKEVSHLCRQNIRSHSISNLKELMPIIEQFYILGEYDYPMIVSQMRKILFGERVFQKTFDNIYLESDKFFEPLKKIVKNGTIEKIPMKALLFNLKEHECFNIYSTADVSGLEDNLKYLLFKEIVYHLISNSEELFYEYTLRGERETLIFNSDSNILHIAGTEYSSYLEVLAIDENNYSNHLLDLVCENKISELISEQNYFKIFEKSIFIEIKKISLLSLESTFYNSYMEAEEYIRSWHNERNLLYR